MQNLHLTVYTVTSNSTLQNYYPYMSVFRKDLFIFLVEIINLQFFFTITYCFRQENVLAKMCWTSSL